MTHLVAGRVGRSHGLDGSFYVTRPRSSLLTVGAVILLGERQGEITRVAGTDQKPILAVDCCKSREEAQQLRSVEIRLPLSEVPPLAAGEYYVEQLEGCHVFDGKREVGQVRAVVQLPSCEALEVQRPDDVDDLLVPLVKDAIRSIAVESRRIEINLHFVAPHAD